MVQKVNLEMTEGVQEKFDTVTEALDKRTIYVGSVSELEALPSPTTGQEAIVQGVPFRYDGTDWLPSAGFVTPECYGAVGDGVADDTAALQSAIDYGSVIFGHRKEYLFTADLSASKDSVWIGQEATITGLGAGVEIVGADDAYEVLSASISRGDTSFSYGSVTSAGELVKVYIDLDNSWLDDEPQSKLGDLYEILSDGEIKSEFEFDFPATDSKIKRVQPITAKINNLSINTTGSNNSLRLEHCINSRLESVKVKNADSLRGIYVKECFNTSLENCYGECYGTASGFQYGVSLDESKNTEITGGFYYGTRHGVAINASGTGIVNHALIFDATIANDSSQDLYSADMHGVCNDVHYDKCRIKSGVAVAGRSPKYTNNKIHAIPSSAYNPVKIVNLEGGNVIFKENEVFLEESTSGFAVNWQAVNRIPWVRQDTQIDISDNTFHVSSSFFGIWSMATNGDNPYGVSFTNKVDRNHIDGDLSGMIRLISQSEAGTGTSYEVKLVSCQGNTFGEAPISTFSLLRLGNPGSLASTEMNVRGVTKRLAFGINSGSFEKRSNQALPYSICNLPELVQSAGYIENNDYNGDVFPFAYAAMTTATNADLVITTGNKNETFTNNDTLNAVFEFYIDRVGTA